MNLPSPDHDNPGPLRGVIALELHTIQAARLIRGRAHSGSRPAIIGLIGFASVLRPIWTAAAGHDLRAYWHLIQIEAQMDQVMLTLDELRHQLQAARAMVAALSIGPSLSETPRRFDLNFQIPYAYDAARLIAEYDGVAAALLAAGRVGVLKPESLRSCLDQGGRALRRTFAEPLGFKPSPKDALTTRTQEGEPLPDALLRGELRPRHLPVRP